MDPPFLSQSQLQLWQVPNTNYLSSYNVKQKQAVLICLFDCKLETACQLFFSEVCTNKIQSESTPELLAN